MKLNLNEAQETVKFQIMINPMNRMKIRGAAEKLYNEKIKQRIGHNGEPLLSTLRGLIFEEGEDLTLEEKINLQVAMYFNELKEVEELA